MGLANSYTHTYQHSDEYVYYDAYTYQHPDQYTYGDSYAYSY